MTHMHTGVEPHKQFSEGMVAEMQTVMQVMLESGAV
jgi:hypothetical protein